MYTCMYADVFIYSPNWKYFKNPLYPCVHIPLIGPCPCLDHHIALFCLCGLGWFRVDVRMCTCMCTYSAQLHVYGLECVLSPFSHAAMMLRWCCGGVEVVFIWMNHPYAVAKIRWLRRWFIATPIPCRSMALVRPPVISLSLCVCQWSHTHQWLWTMSCRMNSVCQKLLYVHPQCRYRWL